MGGSRWRVARRWVGRVLWWSAAGVGVWHVGAGYTRLFSVFGAGRAVAVMVLVVPVMALVYAAMWSVVRAGRA